MSGPETRVALLAAAERLFALHGIDGPSLREITKAAGQRNTGALQYHFGTRAELLRAVLAEHEPDIRRQRHGLLDQFELAENPEIRSLAGALVLPYVAKLEDESGRCYLQIINDIFSRPVPYANLLSSEVSESSLIRWSKAAETFLPPDAIGRPLHRRFAMIRFSYSEMASRSREEHSDHQLFTSHLLDMLGALMTAPVSKPTKKLIKSSMTR